MPDIEQQLKDPEVQRRIQRIADTHGVPRSLATDIALGMAKREHPEIPPGVEIEQIPNDLEPEDTRDVDLELEDE